MSCAACASSEALRCRLSVVIVWAISVVDTFKCCVVVEKFRLRVIVVNIRTLRKWLTD